MCKSHHTSVGLACGLLVYLVLDLNVFSSDLRFYLPLWRLQGSSNSTVTPDSLTFLLRSLYSTHRFWSWEPSLSTTAPNPRLCPESLSHPPDSTPWPRSPAQPLRRAPFLPSPTRDDQSCLCSADPRTPAIIAPAALATPPRPGCQYVRAGSLPSTSLQPQDGSGDEKNDLVRRPGKQEVPQFRKRVFLGREACGPPGGGLPWGICLPLHSALPSCSSWKRPLHHPSLRAEAEAGPRALGSSRP